MSEEEIISKLSNPKSYNFEELLKEIINKKVTNFMITRPELVKGLLELYNSLKEENEKLKIKNTMKIIGNYDFVSLEELIKDDFISKDKIKELLEELKRPDHLDYEYYRTIDYVAEKLGIELED